FMLVNEKLNKIELNLQSKLNDFESKMRKNLDHQQKLTNIMKQDYESSSASSDAAGGLYQSHRNSQQEQGNRMPQQSNKEMPTKPWVDISLYHPHHQHK